jgi:aminopeptidase N
MEKDFDNVSPTLWGLVLNTTAKYGDKSVVDKFKHLTKTLTNSMAVNQTVRAMGYISDRALLKETLEWAFLSDELVTGNVPRIVFGASDHQVGREVSWEVFQANFETIEKRLHKGPFLFAMTIEASTIFASSDKADEVTKFFEKTKIVGVDRTIQQSIDKIRGRATIANRSTPALASWFSSHGY